MKRNRIRQISLIVVSMMLLSLLGSGTSIASEPGGDRGPVATISVRPRVISWEAQAENGGLALTISGPGDFYLQQEYESGAYPTFKPVDGWGNPLPDGVYNYELLVLPAKWEAPTEYNEALRGLAPPEGATEALVLSGSFSILNGGFVTQDAVEGGAEAKIEQGEELMDQVILDDLIVDGSACIGFDCVNGESFGFDTIRLKENNLRIKFQDTSSTSWFPSNDWQITANDSANGGLNKFSIDDIDGGRTPFTIEAGAPSHSLYVDDYGRVGFGTSTPGVELDIKDRDTPTVRLQQSGSWYAPQTWDVAGNEANFFIRDATHGFALPFRIQPGANTDSLTIKSDEKIGIGTWSPAAKFHIENTSGDDVDDFVVTADGEVGIGTTSPDASLHVERTSGSAEIRVESGATSSDFPMLSLENTNSGYRYDLRTQGIQFVISRFLSGVNEFTLEPNGDLKILGNYFSGGTQLNVPDYVFEKDYSLMPLDELRAYIAREKHLPNVPAADEITKDGLNLGQFQMRLLEKIEELTLYTLAQQGLGVERDAEIAVLNQQNAELEERVAALEALVTSLVQGSGVKQH